MKYIKFATSTLILSSLFFAGSTFAQDSGTGIDFAFGSKIDAMVKAPHHDCDPRGMSWLSAERKRSPSGALYICAPEILAEQHGNWVRSGQLSLGWLFTGGDTSAANWLRYSDWNDHPIGVFGLSMARPSDGTYVELRASHVSSDNQYAKLVAGRAGHYKVEAFARSQPNVMSTTAHSIWNGVGTHQLTLAGGLLPAQNLPEQVAAVSAAATPVRLQVTRDKQGLALNYFFDRRWTGYFGATNEQRKGARAFGGAFFFNYPFPGNGGAHETPRPIDDSTVNVNSGMRYVGNVWRMDLAYRGSLYRSRRDLFTYENPFALWTVVGGATSISPLVGEFATEPDNDHHDLRATLTRKLSMNGELSLSAGGGSMRQNAALLPPANCTGSFGIDLSPLGSPVNPYLFDCADWNTPAALSRRTADLRIDTTQADANLVLQPSQKTTLRANAKFRREDYRNSYLAFNPTTGQWGYVAENGAQGAVVPGEMGIYDPVLTPGVVTRIRSLPLDKEIHEVSVGADFRPDRRNTFGVTYIYTDTERTNRERRSVEDNVLKLNWANRSLDWMVFRANYQFLKRKGDEYNFDPYEFTFSSSLPGFVPDPAAAAPHTVDALRKYDVAGRDQHKLSLIATVMPTSTTSLGATIRGDWNDYDAELGRQNYDTWGFSLSWDWQPTFQTSASAYLGWDRAKLRMANVNEIATAPADPTLGGVVYDERGRWWADDEHRNRNVGATLTHDFGRVTFDASWNFVHTRGVTGFNYASPAALAWPDLAESDMAGRFPQMTYRVNTLGIGLSIPLKDRWALRVFDTYERGQITDWHYQGLNDGLVIDHRTYLDAGPAGYNANLFGVMLEVKL